MESVVLVCAVALLCFLSAASCQQRYAGESCSTSGGQPGVCTRIDSCPPALEDFSHGRTPTICSFDRRTPVVCCVSTGPVTTTTVITTTSTTKVTTTPRTVADRDGQGGGSISKRMCERYAAAVWHEETAPTLALDDDEPPERVNKSDCGIQRTAQLIIGGEPADPKEFPHMAAIGFGDEQSIAWLCGGTLISETFVLTAAHCVSAGNRGLARWVRLGDLNLARSDDDARPQQFAVAERIRHPKYSAFSHYDDIALLRLDGRARLDPYVRPACLHVDRSVAPDYYLASGWGLVDWADETGSDDLMKVHLAAVSAADCSKAYRSLVGTRKLKYGIQDESMLCAGVVEGGKDTCRGDSGGPLQFQLDQPFCMYSVAGLTSFGSTVCGARNLPAIYTRVSNYVSWIENIVWP